MTEVVNMSSVVVILALAVVNKGIIDWFITPLFDRFSWDKKLIIYVSGVTGFVLGLFTNLTLFKEGLFASPIVDKVILALLIGGGASLIHDALDKPAVEQTLLIRECEDQTQDGAAG